jgi:sulfur carrier protein
VIAITVNGDPRQVSEGTTLSELLEALGFRAEGVAVAVNLEVVPRATLADHRLRPGDRVELVRAVGGG